MTKLDANVIDSLRSYHKHLTRSLEMMGVERKDRRIDAKVEVRLMEDRKELKRIWLRDSLLWTIEELLEGRYVYALRGLLQAAGYAGEVGHQTYTQDAYLAIRNAMEDVLKEGR